MATRSFIATKNFDGTITGIYCHYDGYPSGVGKTLTTSYTDPTTIDELIGLGSISSLGDTLTETVAYSRDRGEKHEGSTEYKNESDMLANAWSDLGAEYAYVWGGSSWETYDLRKTRSI